MTNLEGRVHPPPPGPAAARGVLDDLHDPRRAGRPARPWRSTSPTTRATVFDELRRASAPAAWPTTPASPTSASTPSRACSGRARPRTTRAPRGCSPIASRPRRPGQASSRSSTAPRPSCPTRRYPYVLTTGRLMAALPVRHPDPTGRRRWPSRRRPGGAAAPRPGPSPAASRAATSSSSHPRAGRALFRAHSIDDIRPDTVFVPFHWGGASAANALTNPALDPHSRMPEFKACAVAVTRLDRPRTTASRSTTPDNRSTAPSHATQARRCERTHDDQPQRLPPGRLPLRRRGHGQAGPGHCRAPPPRPGRRGCQALYFRGGNTSTDLVTVVLRRDGVPMRYFPIGAKGDCTCRCVSWRTSRAGPVDELLLADERADRPPRRRPRDGGALMTSPATCLSRAATRGPHGCASSSWATGWPARAPSRRSSRAAAPASSRSPCSATSPTATTTASCSATSCRARSPTRTSS